MSRTGCNYSTNCSNGTSWCAYAPQSHLPHLLQHLPEAPLTPRFLRAALACSQKIQSTALLPAASGWRSVVPTRQCPCCPAYRPSSTCTPARSVMNSVTPSRRLNSLIFPVNSSPNSTSTVAPRWYLEAGSDGQPATPASASPASCSFQYFICSFSSPPASHSRCHTA